MTLDELKTLESAATPGPWEKSDDVPGAVAHIDQRLKRPMNVFGLDIDGYAVCSHRPDAAFIAAARTMLPRLIAVAEAATRVARCIGDGISVLKGSAYHTHLAAALAALEAP